MIVIYMEKEKRKGKRIGKENDNLKSKSVEPIATDDDISIDLNIKPNNNINQQNENDEKNKTNEIQKEVDEKWALHVMI